MTMIPQLGAAVKAVLLPVDLRNTIWDAVLTAPALSPAPFSDADDLLPDEDFLPADERVREVLKNGGFTREGMDRHGRVIYSYERISRDELPLVGAEAKHPPKYEMPTLGILVCFCSCLAYRTSHESCKHMDALTWWLATPTKAERAGGRNDY